MKAPADDFGSAIGKAKSAAIRLHFHNFSICNVSEIGND
jgi:hypothetical protein